MFKDTINMVFIEGDTSIFRYYICGTICFKFKNTPELGDYQRFVN